MPITQNKVQLHHRTSTESSTHNIMGDDKIIMKNKIFHNNTIMLLWKTFFFTPDETKFDDLVKVCDLLIIYSVYWGSWPFYVINRVKNRMRSIHALQYIQFNMATTFMKNNTLLSMNIFINKKIKMFWTFIVIIKFQYLFWTNFPGGFPKAISSASSHFMDSTSESFDIL